jgi:small-conductance mechanosensitive channel
MKPDVVVNEASEVLRTLTWERGLIAFAVMLAFIFVAMFFGRVVRRQLSERAHWGGSVFALSKLITYFLVFVGSITALSLLGVPLSSLLLTSSALLVGIGFSLQHVAQDFIAGIILLVEQPIRKNDFITFGTTAGTVQQIGLRATHLLTVDGTDLVVPNHLLVTTEVYNHSHPLKRARLNVEVPVSLYEDVDVVKETLLTVARSHSRVMSEPPPIARFEAILQSHFQFALIVWVEEANSAVRVASELRYAIAHAFTQRGIHLPTPELVLRRTHDPPNAPDSPQPRAEH